MDVDVDEVVLELVMVVDCDTDDSVVGAERDDRITGPSLPLVMMFDSD